LYAERTLAGARFVFLRLMGGASYWPYGLERLRALARSGAITLVVVPGEERWDEFLAAWSSVPPETARLLWRYAVEGGPVNAANALRLMAHLLGEGALPDGPLPLPRAGCYRAGAGPLAVDDALAGLEEARPLA